MSDQEPSNRGGRVVPLARKGGSCPICGAASRLKYRPFCSERCVDLDLGRWLKGSYRIPSDEAPDPDEIEDEPE
jgi:endogenous inhibitor of DNA gyrase (YacG/DUF329 family)